ncbi:hypothetical protein [Ornithinimicrobium sp. Y1694]|uniref:hypothetical protein n=1 Tax=Ornithinimicrobium sp. Y1694 TaxID=3418590 RepID=UPI003CF5A0EE
MREIDRVRRRNRWRSRTDRVTTILVGLLVVTAVITLLPQRTQQQIIALGCTGVTLGVTDCVARLYQPPTPALRAMPLCPVDQVAEQMVPTVETQRISFTNGGVLERWVARDGTVSVVAEPSDSVASIWQEEDWPEATLLPGVRVPLSAQWRFTEDAQERDFVAALQQQHARHHQRRSAIAGLIPTHADPDTLRSVTPAAWVTETPTARLAGIVQSVEEGTTADLPGQVRPSADVATVVHDTEAGTVATTIGATGISPSGAPVHGAFRWTRAETGELVELSGSWTWAEGESAAIVHLYTPLAEGDGTEVEAWLADPDGPALDLSFLTAERRPERGNDLERLLYAAGTVAVEHRDGNASALGAQFEEDLAMDRRRFGELSGERSATLLVRPQPSGSDRLPQEVSC